MAEELSDDVKRRQRTSEAVARLLKSCKALGKAGKGEEVLEAATRLLMQAPDHPEGFTIVAATARHHCHHHPSPLSPLSFRIWSGRGARLVQHMFNLSRRRRRRSSSKK